MGVNNNFKALYIYSCSHDDVILINSYDDVSHGRVNLGGVDDLKTISHNRFPAHNFKKQNHHEYIGNWNYLTYTHAH